MWDVGKVTWQVEANIAEVRNDLKSWFEVAFFYYWRFLGISEEEDSKQRAMS